MFADMNFILEDLFKSRLTPIYENRIESFQSLHPVEVYVLTRLLCLDVVYNKIPDKFELKNFLKISLINIILIHHPLFLLLWPDAFSL